MLVELYYSGQKVSELRSEYDVSKVTIYKWIKDFTPVNGSDKNLLTLKGVTQIQE